MILLDFHKLLSQIEAVGAETLIEDLSPEEILRQAEAAWDEAALNPDDFARRLGENQGWTLWPLALPLERFGQSFAPSESISPVTVVAADGSQIMPSHHEVFSCYLLNIGLTVITYGAKFPPLLETVPRLYHKAEDLYPLVDRRRLHIDELYVSLERNLLELECLERTAISMRESRQTPVLALVDGSLIPWSVERMPVPYQKTFAERMAAVLAGLREAGIPIFGYLSHSRSSELLNCLRVWRCPYRQSDCRAMCGHLNEEDFPCSAVWPLADRQLAGSRLPYRQRTPVFLSGASASRLLPEAERACFVYVNVGYEVARLEFPRWLADESALFDVSLSSVLAQVDRGRGYPVCLAEAHNLAVVRSQDRARFFDLLSRHLVEHGLKRVAVSPKESRKRRGIV